MLTHDASKPSLELYKRHYPTLCWEDLDPIIENLVCFEFTREVAQWIYKGNCSFCRAFKGLYIYWAKSKPTSREFTEGN